MSFYSEETINNLKHVPKTSKPKQSIDYSNNLTLQIKEEQLDLAKKWLQTGEAKVYRETYTEEKNFTVPLKREELVIKKKTFTSTTTEHKDVPVEVIRILLSEEQVEFTKRKVAIEDVAIYKHQPEDLQHIEETLKREECKIQISGSAKIRDESSSKHAYL